MRSATRTLALAAAICATLAATALAVTPPPGTPDLSQMTVQASDLSPGAELIKAGYVTAPAGVVAEYSRQWGPARTAKGRPVLAALSGILLFSSPADASSVFGSERRVFSSKADRPLVAKEIAASSGRSKLKPKDISIGRARKVAIGEAAFSLPLTLRVRKSRAAVEIYVLEVNDVLGEVLVFGTSRKGATAGGHELASDVAAHISAVLGATGATGPTGTT